ncbi:xylulokinase [Rubellicoccus peritrichatus]|uniref:FGGY family carbohydrate kinase n=1 Tax=Rubellicoccus peritrichatus TaxID=3080537 RepID=A0AAQ3QVI5_9BACT|nr:FGGY family carbohydrate kinase [Puniceicoccus sp. CR14]WOO40935.1 FGGY family carbohydrate kinase [Puniceicoccus sp. CR14]
MPLTLGIDASTQSCSAIVIDSDAGNIVAEASVNFGADLPQYNAPSGFIPGGKDGEVHSDPLMWLEALELCIIRLKEEVDLSQIDAISGAGQQHGTVYLNASWPNTLSSLNSSSTLAAQLKQCLSRKTSPIWMDTSTGTECQEITESVGGDESVCQKSGSIAIERFSGPQIRRFFKTEPEAYEKTHRIHMVSSFLCSVLIGADAPIDHGDGAGMNLLNINTWEWDLDLLKATASDLSEKLPPVRASDTIAGKISDYFCKKYSFKQGTPVVTFTGDNPSSLVGMGASSAGKVVISLGTSDTFFAAMPETATDPRGYGHVFGNPSGGCMTLQCFLNGSLAREKVKDHFNMDWDTFTTALSETPAGNDGNQMVPFFGPEISPRVTMEKPLLRGTESFTQWQDANAAIRACVEGQFLNMRERTAWMKLQPSVVFLTGGASQNDEIAKIVANVFKVQVQRLSVSGSVALGAAMRAAVTANGTSLNDLESKFSQPESGKTIQFDPASAQAYDGNQSLFAEL